MLELTELSINFFYALVILFLGCAFISWLYKYIYKIRIINKIDGPYMLPLIGNLHQIKQGPGEFLNKKRFFFFCLKVLFKEFLKLMMTFKKNYNKELVRLWIGNAI